MRAQWLGRQRRRRMQIPIKPYTTSVCHMGDNRGEQANTNPEHKDKDSDESQGEDVEVREAR